MLAEGREFARYVLDRNPFIKVLGISGSLSNPDRSHHDDIDFFVITGHGNVWECFALCLWHGFRYARKHRRPRTHFCFNYVIDESHAVQEIEDTEKAANEYLNVVVLFGQYTYQKILRQKKGMKDFYPERYKKTLASSLIKEKNKPALTQKTPLILKIIRPFIRVLTHFMSWRRKIKQKRLTGRISRKIYTNRYVIRSHFYE